MRIASVAVAVTLLAASAAAAHHGWSGYDNAHALTIDDVITHSSDEHPHGHVRLATPGKTWNITMPPPWRMERRGLTPEMLKPGTKARLVGYPHRTDPHEMRGEQITIGDTTFELR